jgi:hypothetical protein
MLQRAVANVCRRLELGHAADDAGGQLCQQRTRQGAGRSP